VNLEKISVIKISKQLKVTNGWPSKPDFGSLRTKQVRTVSAMGSRRLLEIQHEAAAHCIYSAVHTLKTIKLNTKQAAGLTINALTAT